MLRGLIIWTTKVLSFLDEVEVVAAELDAAPDEEAAEEDDAAVPPAVPVA